MNFCIHGLHPSVLLKIRTKHKQTKTETPPKQQKNPKDLTTQQEQNNNENDVINYITFLYIYIITNYMPINSSGLFLFVL